VVLTMVRRPEMATQAIKAGAMGYVLKSFRLTSCCWKPWMRLQGRVAHIALPLPRKLMEVLAELPEAKSSGAELSEPYNQLSPREMEVLKLIAENLSNREICREIVYQRHTREGTRQGHLPQAAHRRPHPGR